MNRFLDSYDFLVNSLTSFFTSYSIKFFDNELKWNPQITKYLKGYSILYLFLNLFMIGILINIGRNKGFQLFDIIVLVLFLFQLILSIIIWNTPSSITPLSDVKQSLNSLEPTNLTLLICKLCNRLPIIRSKHCIYCNNCIRKHIFHSFLFNKCIDAKNHVIFLMFYLFLFLFSFFHLLSLFIDSSKAFIFSFKVFLELILSLINLIYSIKNFITLWDLAAKNITINEYQNFRILTYLWNNQNGGFFNPFDRGLKNNLIQIVLPVASLLYYSKYSNVPTEIENTMENQEIYDGNFNPNWDKINLYSVLDITNAKMREGLMEKINCASNNSKKNKVALKDELEENRKTNQIEIITE